MAGSRGARSGLARFISFQLSIFLAMTLPAALMASLWFCYGDLLRTWRGCQFFCFAVVLSLLAAFALAPLLSWRSLSAMRSLARERDRWAKLACTDPLTALLNRRGFDEAVRRLPRGGALAVMICDLDHFKRVNDLYGHDVGDAVLRSISALLSELCAEPSGSILGRQGGEEFAVALPGVGLEAARACAETLRARFAARAAPVASGSLRLTVSIGLAGVAEFDGAIEPLMRAADTALYCAKRDGRNRVETAGGELPRARVA